LPRVVLHTAENDKSDGRTLGFYYIQNIFFSKGKLPFTGMHLNDGVLGIESMEFHLGSKCVLLTNAALKLGENMR
jgi:hypothetical protein